MTRTLPNSSATRSRLPVLITGGAGFIGTNVADRYLTAGASVRIFDNLSRRGVQSNLDWLLSKHGSAVSVITADLRDSLAVAHAVAGSSHVFHFGAQVAVTTSLENPREDFDVNLAGTLNVLEALRKLENPPSLIFTSTNKVYGQLEEIQLGSSHNRYSPLDSSLRKHGVGEKQALRFASPYGCSKGAADQYVLDYARTYGLRALVFRMSCIYGPHQLGNQDQGWVAHFLIRALESQPITLYGDGRQVRDILFVEDLVNAFVLAHQGMDKLSGEAFNLGGGPANSVSLVELIRLIGELNGREPVVCHAPWRRADQKYYVSDIRKFARAAGWRPEVSVPDGVGRLFEWLVEARGEWSQRNAPARLRSQAAA